MLFWVCSSGWVFSVFTWFFIQFNWLEQLLWHNFAGWSVWGIAPVTPHKTEVINLSYFLRLPVVKHVSCHERYLNQSTNEWIQFSGLSQFEVIGIKDKNSTRSLSLPLGRLCKLWERALTGGPSLHTSV